MLKLSPQFAAHWSDDRVTMLKKLWEDGLSASEIANELGNVSRNGVIGKIHRLGLSGRRKRASTKAPRERRPRAEPKIRFNRPMSCGNTALAEKREVEAESGVAAFDNVVPMSQRVTLSELTKANCHWPVGDPSSPDFFFCGGMSVEGTPYCTHHCSVAYRPVRMRTMRDRTMPINMSAPRRMNWR